MAMMFQNAALRAGRRRCTAGASGGGYGTRLYNSNVAARATSTSLTNFVSSQNAAVPKVLSATSSNSGGTFSNAYWKQQQATPVRGFQPMLYAPALERVSASSSQQQTQKEWAVRALAAAAVTAGVLLNAADNDLPLSRTFCCGIVGVVGKKDHGDARYIFLFFSLL
jgi:hypothetical protein